MSDAKRAKVDELGVPLVDSRKGPAPGLVKHKLKREAMFREQRKAKMVDQRKRRQARKEARAALGDKAPPIAPPRTIENTRVKDETIVNPDDEEIAQDEATDELATYFNGKRPKIVVTTSFDASARTLLLAEELINLFPDATYRPRRKFAVKEIVKQAVKRDFTDVIVLNDDNGKPTGMHLIHLPNGPTVHFKMSSVQLCSEIPEHGSATMHYPEVIVNNFHTRLGHQVGRMIMALFPQKPEFEGRAVVTFHNQRDFIFVRRHRYIFRGKDKVGLQELGPRFTLKVRSLQHGTFDSEFGEYEFVYKAEMGVNKRQFYL